MSIRSYNFRQGDRSEYLAIYLMSEIGLVTSVPRQEDVGIDLYCNISYKEGDKLSFANSFTLQIKSDSVKKINIGGLNHKQKHLKHDVDWIYNLDQPLLFGFVNKKDISIEIYSISSFRFLFYEKKNCSEIEFIRPNEISKNHIGKYTQIKIENWPSDTSGDGFKYTINLGNPIVKFNHEDLESEERLLKIKKLLTEAIHIETQNIVYRNLLLPYFLWILIAETNEKFEVAFNYYPTSVGMTDVLERATLPSIISLALTYKQNNNIDKLKPILEHLKSIGNGYIPKEIQNVLCI